MVFCLFLILVALPPRPLSSSASMNDPELLFPPGVTFLFPSPHQTRCSARHPSQPVTPPPAAALLPREAPPPRGPAHSRTPRTRSRSQGLRGSPEGGSLLLTATSWSPHLTSASGPPPSRQEDPAFSLVCVGALSSVGDVFPWALQIWKFPFL